MVIIVMCGDRNWNNRAVIRNCINNYTTPYDIIVEGGCTGADLLVKQEGLKLGRTVITVNANWRRYGKTAGPIRNKIMMSMKPALVIAFHDNIEQSKGTKNMLSLAMGNTEWILINSKEEQVDGFIGS